MTTETILTVVLPLALSFIMFGFGLTLTLSDFKMMLERPRTVLIGLFCQMILLPLLAYGICKAFGLTGETAIGVMILSASPGGVSANIFSHLAHGDIALNLTLTAVNSLLAAFFLPFMVNVAFYLFAEEGNVIGLQFAKTIQVVLVVVIPVALGMYLKIKRPSLTKTFDKPVRVFSVGLLVVIVVGTIIKERAILGDSFAHLGFAMLLFNVGSMALGYFVGKMAKLKIGEITAITMEVGVHNSTLALMIAVGLLGSFTIAIPAAVYSVIMYLTAGLFCYILALKHKAKKLEK